LLDSPDVDGVEPEDISVVICTNRAERLGSLEATVASLRSQVRGPREIIVVVDGGPDLEARVRSTLAGVVVVVTEGPPCLSAARNKGVEVARGPVVAFIDDDARAERDWLTVLAAAYEPGVIGVGGAVQPEWRGTAPGWLPSEFYWTIGCSYRGLPPRREAVRNPIGCNMSLRRTVFAAGGGFRADLGRVGADQAGCEETELCLRWSRLLPDARFLYEPAAVVHHLVAPERARWSYYLRRCFAEGRSKAVVARLWGAGSLGAERTHALSVLRPAVGRELARLAVRRDTTAGAQAAAIVAGAAAVTAGYLRGLVPASP
jgi:glycosyltransferase involved in cell wall biosynthesis